MKLFFVLFLFSLLNINSNASAQTTFARIKKSDTTLVFREIIEFRDKVRVGNIKARATNGEETTSYYNKDYETDLIDLICRELGYGKGLGPTYIYGHEEIKDGNIYLGPQVEFMSGSELKLRGIVKRLPDDHWEPIMQPLRGVLCEKSYSPTEANSDAIIIAEKPIQFQPKLYFGRLKEMDGVVIIERANMMPNVRPLQTQNGDDYSYVWFLPSYQAQLAKSLCERMGYSKGLQADPYLGSQFYDFRIYLGPDGNFIWGIDLKKVMTPEQIREGMRTLSGLVCGK